MWEISSIQYFIYIWALGYLCYKVQPIYTSDFRPQYTSWHNSYGSFSLFNGRTTTFILSTDQNLNQFIHLLSISLKRWVIQKARQPVQGGPL